MFGFFYAWICSTMWGLDAADPNVAISAMQAMNASVRNPVFALGYFGTPLLLAAVALVAWKGKERRAAILLGMSSLTAIFCFAGLVRVVGRRSDGVERKARVGAAGSVASGVGERSGTRFGLKRDAEVAVRTHRSHRGYRRAKIRGGVIKA